MCCFLNPGCCTCFLVLILIVPQLLVACFLATDYPLPERCIVPYKQDNSFDVLVDLHFLLQWLNILVLSSTILVLWTWLIETSNTFRALCLALTGILFVMLIPITITSMRVLFENNPGCWYTLHGLLVLAYLSLIVSAMGCIFLVLCCMAVACPAPHDPADPNP